MLDLVQFFVNEAFYGVPIYQLLYKEGTNLFENVKIPAENSIDGQEHIVNSQEEFITYYRNKEKGDSKARM